MCIMCPSSRNEINQVSSVAYSQRWGKLVHWGDKRNPTEHVTSEGDTLTRMWWRWTSILKVVNNENGGASGRWQVLGTGLEPWRSRFIFRGSARTHYNNTHHLAKPPCLLLKWLGQPYRAHGEEEDEGEEPGAQHAHPSRKNAWSTYSNSIWWLKS